MMKTWLRQLKKWPWPRIGRWVMRVGLMGGVMASMATRPPYVMVGPQQEVETEHPVLCVHTRLIDEVEEWKIQRTLVMAREMGATRVVEFFPWPYVSPSEGEYNWGRFDPIIDHANAQGLEVIARLGMAPSWLHPEDPSYEPTDNSLRPEHFEAFADYVEAFAREYAGRVDMVIIWNEPNLAFEWGYQPVIPENYVDLLRAAYPAAKRGNPDVIVLAGALAPTLEPEGSQFGMNEIDYLTGLYEEGFSDYYDGLAAHTYGFKFPATEPPAPEVLNYRRVELLREIMVEYGDGDKPVIITESGWNDHPRWTKAVRPGQRIIYTIEGLEYSEEQWPWVEGVCIWAMRYPFPVQSYPDYFTLVAADFTPKPIYTEIKAWARGEQ